MNDSSRSLSLVACLALATALASCSSSDNSPTGPVADTVAPVVISVNPSQDDTGVGLNDQLTIAFNEPMTAASDVANVLLSEGTVTSLTWLSNTSVQIAHSGWTAGANIQATLGVAFTDTSGNALAAPRVWDFWTATTSPQVLQTSLPEGATNVSRNVTIAVLFSSEMNLTSLDAATALTNNGVAPKRGLGFEWISGEGTWVNLVFTTVLDANTSYTVDVATTAQTNTGTPLGAAFQFNFTTGITSDTTAPTLVSVVPANGTVISANTSSLVMTFSEPIDRNNFDPSLISAQFDELFTTLGIDLTWNAAGTQLTVPLPTPLPAGLPIAVRFDSFFDLAGNEQTTPIDYRVDVAGTPDFWPFVDGRSQLWSETWNDVPAAGSPNSGSGLFSRHYEDQGNGRFRLADYDDPGLSILRTWDEYQPLADRVNLVAFADSNGQTFSTTTISPAVPFALIPFAAQSWSGTTTAVSDQGSATITYTVTVVGQEDLYGNALFKAIPAVPGRVWLDTWKAALNFELSDPNTGAVFTAGTDSIWFAPVTGLIQRKSHETGDDGTFDSFETYLGPVGLLTK